MCFKSWRSFFDFSRAVKQDKHHDETINNFLGALNETAFKRRIIIDENSTVARAQKGCCYKRQVKDMKGEIIDEIESPFPPERMKPTKEKCKEYGGRADPKGVRCLYVSDDLNTALAEVRPWIGSKITLYKFKIVKDIQVINCTQDDSTMVYFKEPDSCKREKSVWSDINRAFSKPVSNYESDKEYKPTQKIAMFLKKKGFDGIKYKSSVGKKSNYVYFDIEVAEPIEEESFVFNTKDITYEFDKIF